MKPMCVPYPVASLLQALGLLVQVEGTKFGRRVPAILPLLATSLQKGVQSMEDDQEMSQHEGEDGSTASVSGWQELYACLLLLERIAITVPNQVRSCPISRL